MSIKKNVKEFFYDQNTWKCFLLSPLACALAFPSEDYLSNIIMLKILPFKPEHVSACTISHNGRIADVRRTTEQC